MKKFICSICIWILCTILTPVSILANEEVEIYSDYAIVINLEDNRVMYEKNANERMYPASMTKMMSVLVAIENMKDLQATYTFEESVFEGLAEANASVAGFSVYDKVTYEDLLYGIMLPSGADASRAIAYSLFGSEEKFVEKMNEKAKALKMKNTHFVNTSGLHEDEHYSTASDMAKLLTYALKNKTFKKVFTTHSYTTSDSQLTFKSTFSKQKKGLDLDVSMVKGSKTGYTLEATLCLASYAEKEGEEYIAISGHAGNSNAYPYHIVDAAILYNHIYDTYKRVDFANKEDELYTLDIEYGFDDTYTLFSDSDISFLCKDKNNVKYVWDGVDKITTPMEKDTYLGVLQLVEEDTVLYEQEYYLSKKIHRNYFTYYLDHPFIFVKDFGAFFVAGIMLVIYTKKHPKNKRFTKRK